MNLLAFRHGPTRIATDLLTRQHVLVIDELRSFVEATGPLGPLTFVFAYIVLTLLFVPGSIASLAAGALFGPVLGTLLTLTGATLGAAGAFEISRRLGRARAERLLKGRAASADAWVGERGLGGVIGLRLIPAVPFNALNYAFGLSAVSRRDHLLGTALGIVPGTVAFVALGDSITDPGSIGFLLSVGGVLLLFAASAVHGRRRSSPQPAPEQQPSP